MGERERERERERAEQGSPAALILHLLFIDLILSVMNVTITTTSTSCNPANYMPGNKSTDGTTSAVVSGGIPPYQYPFCYRKKVRERKGS